MDLSTTIAEDKGVSYELRNKSAKRGRVRTLSRASLSGPISTIHLRVQECRDAFDKIQSQVQAWSDQLSSDLGDKVVAFLQNNPPKCIVHMDCVESNHIPLGVIVTGLAGDENSAVFDQIISQVTEVGFTIFARVSCSLTKCVKTAIQDICRQLFGQSKDGKIKAEVTYECGWKHGADKFCSIHDLESWYRRTLCITGDNNQSPSEDTPILIVIEDMEYASGTVLSDLLLVLSCSTIPFAVLVGATSTFAIFDILSDQRKSSATFVVQSFNLLSPHERLTYFINEVILQSNFPIFFSPTVLKYLIDYFRFHHCSLNSLLTLVKLCFLRHFQSAHSLFCIEADSLNSVLDSLVDKDFEESVQGLRALEDRTEEGSKFNRRRGMDGPFSSKKQFIDSWTKIKIKTEEWYSALDFLLEMKTGLPTPQSHSKEDLYCQYILELPESQEEDDQEPIEQFLKMVEILYKKEFEALLKRGQRALALHQGSNLTTENSVIPALLHQVESFIKELSNEKNQETTPKPSDSSRAEGRRTRVNPKKFDRFEHQQKLLNQAKSKNNRIEEEFKKFQFKVLAFLKKTFRDHLKPVTPLSMRRIFSYSDREFLKNSMSPSIQARVHTALETPSQFLNCFTCGEAGTGLYGINEHAPDTSILYRIVSSKKTKILDVDELYRDFFQVIIISESFETKKRKRKRETEIQFILRFRQSLAELQFMGILSGRKRKANEVSKQMWMF